MIALLQGEVVAKGVDRLTLLVSGVGYELSVPGRSGAETTVGAPVTLHVAESIREDAYELFGYLTPDERALHHTLVGVQGVGPRLAHAILSVYDAPVLRELIEAEDLVRLNQISGVGKKTAQRLLLDLKGKLVGTDTDSQAGLGRETDPAVLALVQLGFTRDQAMSALQDVDTTLETSERVRQGLQGSGR